MTIIIETEDTRKHKETVVLHYNHLVSFLHCSKIAPKYKFVVVDACKCGTVIGKKAKTYNSKQADVFP